MSLYLPPKELTEKSAAGNLSYLGKIWFFILPSLRILDLEATGC